MSFFRDKKQLNTLVITGSHSTSEETLEEITLMNNSVLNLNLSGITVTPSNPDITNVDQVVTLKIIIDWGDGETESISPYFTVQDSSINVKAQEWDNVSHTYALHSENGDLTLKIRVFNSLKDCTTLLIPVKVQFQSILESGAKLKLISANITNSNEVSYVLNNIKDKSNMIVTTEK